MVEISIYYVSIITGLCFFFVLLFLWQLNKNHLLTKKNIDLKWDIQRKDHDIRALEARIKDRPQTIELKEFLADMLSGEGLIAVSRVDSSHLFSFSPRERN